MMLVALWRSVRPTQWAKNLVVFAGLIFSRHFDRPDAVLRTVGAFAVFCALASAVYLFNDLRDREADRAHPQKKDRPIAAGLLPVATAAAAAFVLAAAGLIGAWELGRAFLVTVIIYLLLNAAYSVALKRVVIIDVMIVAIGFVLRAVGGAEAIAVEISPWLIVCTILLASFLGFGKRRWELVALGEGAASHRAALERYTTHLLDQLIAVTTASTVVAYALYTLSSETQAKFGTDRLIWTLPFVLYGVFRYLYLIHRERQGGNPTSALLRDWPLVANAALWLATVLVIISRQ